MKMFAAILIGAFCIIHANLFSNNITVSNVSLEGQVVIDHYCLVEFDLSWDNSWRTTSVPQNWDAAWVFVKYSNNGGPWQHAKLESSGSVQPTGCILDFADNTGVFIYRDADGSGTFSTTDIGIRWSYGDQGVADDASVEVKVFAIEMVYVPEGAFYLGDQGYGHFYEYPESGDPYLVDGSSITCGQSSSNLWVDANYGANMNGYSIASTYPTGFSAFYSMKYEISQEQYTDFLNNLTRVQQQTRTSSDVSGDVVPSVYEFVMAAAGVPSHRSSIATPLEGLGTTLPITFFCNYDDILPGNEAGDGQNIACNFLSWMDVAAYADWAGLRPMTEGEYEKACRGPNDPTSQEFANGNPSYTVANYIITNEGAQNEDITNISLNAGNFLHSSTSGNFNGPARCGIFASSSTNHTRIETCASFYGIMEMSGNVREVVVCMFNLAGLSYTGLHGDGTLTYYGNADSDYWPGINGHNNFDEANDVYSTEGVTHNAGAADRGGSFNSSYTECMISDRTKIVPFNQTLTHSESIGGRLVHTAP